MGKLVPISPAPRTRQRFSPYAELSEVSLFYSPTSCISTAEGSICLHASYFGRSYSFVSILPSQLHFEPSLKPWKRVKCFNNRKLKGEMISNVSSPPAVAGSVETNDEKAISSQCWGRRNQHVSNKHVHREFLCNSRCCKQGNSCLQQVAHYLFHAGPAPLRNC